MHSITYLILGMLLIGSVEALSAQDGDSTRTEYLYIEGQRIQALITEDDTLFLAEIDSIQVSSPRKFNSREEYLTYMRYKKYAAKVYPYAKKAVKIYRESEYVTNMMDKKMRKKHLKRLQKELEEDFEEPLKKLTKTQGRILVEMVEREVGRTLHEIIKETRGTFIASYYTGMGTLFNYDLTEGYVKGKDEMMDIVIRDFDVSYDIDKVIQKYQKDRMPMMPNQ